MNENICSKDSLAWILLGVLMTMLLFTYYRREETFGVVGLYAPSDFEHGDKYHWNSSTSIPRVTCMVFVTVAKWKTRGEAIRRTWSRHCYRRRFFYSRPGNAELPDGMRNISEELAPLDVPEGRQHLTTKTMTALEYSFRNFHNDTDWFMKADDDLYIVYHNLVAYLSRFDPSEPYYIGSKINTQRHIPHGYNSGGGSYLVSHEAASLVVTKGRERYPQLCAGRKVGGAEDVDMGDCLQKFGIYPVDTRDTNKRNRFESQNPLTLLRGALNETTDHNLEKHRSAEYRGMTFGNFEDSNIERMMSTESISFHYVTPAEIYMYDFLLSLQKPNHYQQQQQQLQQQQKQLQEQQQRQKASGQFTSGNKTSAEVTAFIQEINKFNVTSDQLQLTSSPDTPV